MDRDEASDWSGLDKGLPLCVDRVMGGWSSLVRQESPWDTMTLDDLTGELRRVLIELVNAGWDHDEEACRHRIAAAAREHGAFRRAQCCPRNVLTRDFCLLRSAIFRALRFDRWPVSLAREAASNLVPDIRLARQAAGKGFDGRMRRRSDRAL